MGKNKDKKKKTVEFMMSNDEIANLSIEQADKLRKQLDNVTRHYRVKCSHTKKNGEPTIQVVNHDRQIVKCQKCGAEFSLRLISKKEIKNAQNILNDAANQIKVLSNGDKGDDKLVTELGTFAENTEKTGELYVRVIHDGGKNKKKKKHKKHESYGDYGYSNMK